MQDNLSLCVFKGMRLLVNHLESKVVKFPSPVYILCYKPLKEGVGLTDNDFHVTEKVNLSI